ncbi:hypothetical protein HHK36_017350 [Tetracentron sinense]|uniref:Uncharacterized protein n=1 Tax=Tetracentron sinense TaxID=13715 RepID=A0A834Z528_TETSI|nr:hypothetical protein HHK36_017350 [Tetracentron sinense]
MACPNSALTLLEVEVDVHWIFHSWNPVGFQLGPVEGVVFADYGSDPEQARRCLIDRFHGKESDAHEGEHLPHRIGLVDLACLSYEEFIEPNGPLIKVTSSRMASLPRID